MGNVLEPQVMGKSMNLSPIVILLTLIFWGWLWGVVGMFLAVPITAAIKIVFDSIPALKPLAAAMSGE
jgi:predicted PurR-regulated permease PerM